MPIPKTYLNNVPPPTWANPDGTTPPPAGDVTDPSTRLRWQTGQDKMNYFTSQRVQGDLFNRDLQLEGMVRGIIDFLGTRTGITMNLPAFELKAGKYAVLNRLAVPDGINLRLVGASLNPIVGDATGLVLEFWDPIGPSESYDPVPADADGWVWLSELLPSGAPLEVRVRNTSGTDKVVSAFVLVQPQTY